MRQISSAVALLIFNPGNIRPGKSGTEISMDVWVGYLCPLPRLCLLVESVSKPMLSQLSDGAGANTQAELCRHDTRLNRQTPNPGKKIQYVYCTH